MKTTLVAAALFLGLSLPLFAGREEPFRRAVGSCDRLRIRSGGTCHRDEAAEKTLAEVTKKSEIRAFVDGIGIDEAESGGGCMCCGEPTFEFYRGKELLAMVGFHHGQALRWADGKWSGDAALTPKSAEFVCRWLAEHGVAGPLGEWEENRARERAVAERMRRCGKILPPEAFARLQAAGSRADAEAALAAAGADPVSAALSWFRVYGCHEGNWTHYTTVESAARRLLEKAPAEVLGGAVGRLGDDGWALNGAARFVFENWNQRLVPGDALRDALPALAAHAFAHPRQEVRHGAMAGVFRVGGPAAVAALRPVLAGDVKIRELPESDRADAGGSVEMRGTKAEISGATDDRVVAAVLLLELGDSESEIAIRTLRDAVEGPDRECLDSALKGR
jgi:hypothetical protein